MGAAAYSPAKMDSKHCSKEYVYAAKVRIAAWVAGQAS